MRRKKNLDKKNDLYLFQALGEAVANKRYRKGIRILERFRGQYLIPDKREYGLALLYDHLAMRTKKRKELKDKYLEKAEEIYRQIYKRNPNYFHALYGLGRVEGVRGNYKKAIKYQIRAYKKMLRLPKKERGALAIGALYEKMGDYKKAEEWYKRERQETSKDDFGAVFNLFNFYKKNKKYGEALKLLRELEKSIEKEFKRKIYKNLDLKNNKALEYVKKEIKEIKKRALS